MPKRLYKQPSSLAKPNNSVQRAGWLIALFVIIAGGLLAGHVIGQGRVSSADENLRNEMLEEAVFIARTLDTNMVKALSFEAEDSEKVEFQVLGHQLASYLSISEYRGFYTLGWGDGELRFGPESYAADDPEASPPGTVYLYPPPGLQEVFETGLPYVVGPYTDEYGSFVSAFAPVIDARTGEVLAVVGIDIDGSVLQEQLNSELIAALIPVIVLIIILLRGLYLFRLRFRTPVEKHGFLSFIEPAGVLIIGIALSIILSQASHRTEEVARAELFGQLAEGKAQIAVNAFASLQDLHLGALQQFFESSEFITREEFAEFTLPMMEHTAIEAFAWLEPATDRELEEFEALAAEQGLSSFELWELSGGERIPIQPRQQHYLLWYIEPYEENPAGLGYDAASEPTRLRAIETAIRTRRAQASTAIDLVFEEGEDRSIAIYKPVFKDGNLLGITSVAIQVDKFLESLLSFFSPRDDSSLVELYQLEPGGGAELLSSSVPISQRPAHASEHDVLEPHELSAVFPLFSLGEAYAVVISADEQFLISYPLNSWWITLSIGLLITMLMCVVALVLTQRRTTLEDQVRERTKELESSQQALLKAYDATIEGWSRALELRDKETEGHTQRVTLITMQLAERMGVRQSMLQHIQRGALLHDIGKLGVPDKILHKAGQLTEAEERQVQHHPEFAYNMLSKIAYLRPALEIPLYHHERWDGKGYPRRLKGKQIPLAARIFAIVDVYDALVSNRPYRRAWSKARTLAYIKAERGKHFDPKVVDAFIEMMS